MPTAWHSNDTTVAQLCQVVGTNVSQGNSVDETKLTLASKRERRGDSKNTVTVLSHVAVTSLLIHNQTFKYKLVTDDSKFSLFNFLVLSYHQLPLATIFKEDKLEYYQALEASRPKDDEEPDLGPIRNFIFAQQMKYLAMEIKKYKEAENKGGIRFMF